jgi:hypothetical protein
LVSSRRVRSAAAVSVAARRSAIRVKTAATAVRSGSMFSVRIWISVVSVAQAAPTRKKATSVVPDSGVTSPEASAV